MRYCTCIITLLNIIVSVRIVVAVELSSDPLIQAVVDAHESSRLLIHELDVTLEIWDQAFIGSMAEKPPIQTGIWRLSKSNTCERIRNRDFFLDDTGNRTEQSDWFSDLFHDGTQRRLLFRWNPENPPVITPTEQHGVRGVEESETGFLPGAVGDPQLMLLMVFRNARDPSDPRRTLSEFIKASPHVNAVKEESGVVRLDISHSGTDPEHQSASFQVYVDPKAGFMVRTVVEQYPNGKWYGENGRNELIPIKWVREVSKFREFEGGVFFPIETELRIYRTDRQEPTSVVRCVATRIVVNEKLPVDALDFRFPEHLLVQLPPVNGKSALKLWGPNNSPIDTITDGRQLAKYAGGLQVGHRSEAERLRWGLLLATSIVLGILGVVAWYRRHKSAIN